MTKLQQKAISEILDEYATSKNVIGVRLFGSFAVGRERKDSDIDVTVIYNDNREWELFKENRCGIRIDLEFIAKKDWEMMLKRYPYLFYLEHSKILFDKTGFVKNALAQNASYLKANPEVLKFWRNEYNLMRRLKKVGKKPKNFIAVCDEAEIRFSKHHSIKRKVLTPYFFHKYVK
jgi:predicted nucleotidyltransferase